MRVLIAEDSPAFLDRISRHLSQAPDIHIVGSARDGAEALAALDRLRPDLILLDIHMPVRNGLFVLRHGKEKYPLTKFVVLTADDSALILQRCLDLGADAVVRKADAAETLLPAMNALKIGVTSGRTV